MKKLFLLLASGSIALSSVAQQRVMTFDQKDLKVRKYEKSSLLRDKTTASKTTASSRWYVYADYMDQMLTAELGQEVAWAAPFIWNDTASAQVNYTSGLAHINLPSVGMIFDPSANNSYNNPNYYLGEMMVSASDAYTVDSINISGIYTANSGHTTEVDTVRLAFVKGYGGASSSDDIFGGGLVGGGHYGAATFVSMRHDSTKNTAGSGGPGVYVQDILLDNSTYADTNTVGRWFRTVKLNTPISSAANGMVGVSISYINGQSPAVTAGATVYDAVTEVCNNNVFRPAINFASDGTNAQWFPYTAGPDPKADSNVGLFKRYPGTNGWANMFIPTWAWSTSTGASIFQFPDINFFVNCSTCGVVSAVGVKDINSSAVVNAYPNPAGNELNIPFTLNSASDVNITLSNMLGQVVATKNMSNITSGKAVFNTSSLPAGLYTYSVNANGQRTSGRVVVSH
jgi:hypothetical protein